MQLLAEMDGFDNRGDVRIMAATNRVDMLDAALLRPGRFDRIIEIPVPDIIAREDIIKIHTRKMTLSPGVNLAEISILTEGLTGAQIQAVCREAGMLAVRKSAFEITNQDMLDAVNKVAGDDHDVDERMFI